MARNFKTTALDVEGGIVGIGRFNNEKPVHINATGKLRDRLTIWVWGIDLASEVLHRWNCFQKMRRALEAVQNNDPDAVEKVKSALNKVNTRKPVIL